MRRRNWFHDDLQVFKELHFRSKTASSLLFYACKKYKNGNSARRTSTQRHIRPPICYGGSDHFSSGISGQVPKIATSNIIFSRTTYHIAAKYCKTIEEIKPNDIFQNCAQSTSTLIYSSKELKYDRVQYIFSIPKSNPIGMKGQPSSNFPIVENNAFIKCS